MNGMSDDFHSKTDPAGGEGNPHLERMLRTFPDLGACLPEIRCAIEALVGCYRQGGKLLVCGNGGSAADSDHLVAELMKGFLLPRAIPQADREALAAASPEHGVYLAGHLQRALPAISLAGHSALSSAFANDVAADMVFAQQVYGYGRQGDLLLAISTSGRSRNVLYAVEVGKALGLRTAALTGRPGGPLASAAEIAIAVPGENTPAIQERHLAVYHAISAAVEAAFFG